MGQGQEVKTRNDPQVEIQERGEIFFFYRPKVEREAAHSADDVQRLYIVLRPGSGKRPVEEKQDPHSGKEGFNPSSRGKATVEGGHGSQVMMVARTATQQIVYDQLAISQALIECQTQEVNIEKQALLRLIVLGKKSLPDPRQRGRPYWGFVEMVTTKIGDVKSALQAEEYDTSTRGHRHKPAARPLGEGVYRILRHKSSGRKAHTHLIYKLEFPPEGEKQETQESLNVEREGSFLIQIKNPDQHGAGPSQFGGLQSKRKVVFPACLQGQFGQRRFIQADPPDFLNYEGCELLLISASDDIEEELGLELKGECEGDPSCSDLLKTFGETAPMDPLFRGTWA
ncbi:uncharacterized protein LOC125314480 isoform X1 [Rhodamnia argentea]|uniref:Uncharacterized protein LOC125314480 isoform X1 n=1 Tax=Rhodamnia argentea TaxID=178133 RepID=A0ABM3H886_9MYRT|nr:uncharacterized protein LOC125314480 isoform X1 [Rhodamnia argentea]